MHMVFCLFLQTIGKIIVDLLSLFVVLSCPNGQRVDASSVSPSSFNFLAVGSANHVTVTLDANQERQQTGSQNSTSHESERFDVSQLTESKTEAHGTTVSTSSDDTGDGTGGRRIDVWDDSVGGSFRSLDETGKDDEDDNGTGEICSIGENQ